MIDLELGERLEKAAGPRTDFEGDCFGGYNNWEYVATVEQSALVDWLWANATELLAAARERDRLRDLLAMDEPYVEVEGEKDTADLNRDEISRRLIAYEGIRRDLFLCRRGLGRLMQRYEAAAREKERLEQIMVDSLTDLDRSGILAEGKKKREAHDRYLTALNKILSVVADGQGPLFAAIRNTVTKALYVSSPATPEPDAGPARSKTRDPQP